jgi:hypothetical protein
MTFSPSEFRCSSSLSSRLGSLVIINVREPSACTNVCCRPLIEFECILQQKTGVVDSWALGAVWSSVVTGHVKHQSSECPSIHSSHEYAHLIWNPNNDIDKRGGGGLYTHV